MTSETDKELLLRVADSMNAYLSADRDGQMADVPYHQMTAKQKLRAYWHTWCDADPVPIEFCDEMEAAGFIALRPVMKRDLEESFAAERGIELGGMLWELTPAGRAALSDTKEAPDAK